MLEFLLELLGEGGFELLLDLFWRAAVEEAKPELTWRRKTEGELILTQPEVDWIRSSLNRR